jgi:hypothetical protein
MRPVEASRGFVPQYTFGSTAFTEANVKALSMITADRVLLQYEAGCFEGLISAITAATSKLAGGSLSTI